MASSPLDDMEELCEAMMRHQPTADLVTAVRKGDEAGMESALAGGARPEVIIPTTRGVSWNLVSEAAFRGHDHLLPRLLQAGLSIEGEGTDNMTPLMHSAVKGHTRTVKALLTLGANPMATNNNGWTALYFAVQYCHQQCVETLLSVTHPTAVHLKKLTPVHIASYCGHVDVLDQLWCAGWPFTARDRGGCTPQHHAAAGGYLEALQWLVERGGDLRVQDDVGRTPFDVAVQFGRNDVETWLAKNGGGVVRNENRHVAEVSDSPPEHLYEELLSVVSRGDDVQAVSSLLCKGAPTEAWGNNSVLRLAVATNRARTVSLLLASGTSLPSTLLQEAWQSPDVTHNVLASLTTAYCCRLREEQRRLEKLNSCLVEGIKNLVKTIKGNTPWQAAWRWGEGIDRQALSDLLAKAAGANCPVTATYLLRAGAWPFFSRGTSRSALHLALEAGHQSMTELLIRDHGGCLYVPDMHKRLPVHMMSDKDRQRLEQKIFEKEREKLENMELRLKASHEKKAACTALSIQEVLFESYKKGKSWNVSSPDARETLLLASRKGLLQVSHLILQVGRLPVVEVLDDICGTTALHQAASYGQDGCVELLLSAGANTQQCDAYGHTPRHLAAMFGHKSTFELLAHQEKQDPPCRAGTTATQLKDNFKIYHNMYYKYSRKLHSPFDRHDPRSVIRNLVKSIDLPKLQKEAQQMVLDMSKGEALEVKEAILAEINIIMNKVSTNNPTYRGDLRLAGSARDGSKLYAPDEFDINLVIQEDDLEVNVSNRREEEAPLKGRLRISMKTDKPHLEGNRFMASLYEEMNRCLAGHVVQDKRLSLVPPGLTSTQVGVALYMAWQGRLYPLLLVGVDLVPVLEVPWLEQVSRPFLTPKDITTMQLSNAADGTWRCSFALTEAMVLEALTPVERQVQLMGKLLLSRLKAEPWMPRHKKSFFMWFSTREWKIGVPSGFCFKNAFLQWLEQRQRRKLDLRGGWEEEGDKEFWVGQKEDPDQEVGKEQEDPSKWLVEVFRLMCVNPDESREHLATKNSSAYFGGECEGRKPGDGAPIIVQCLEEDLEKFCPDSASAKEARPLQRRY
ncbi:poly [ADP-ribose] polymerase tankyrase-like isoform X3 [Portunus trituberculatus]|uniref:poly [ADP-ribose] polymerase tankyrase-like isoform X3 n=1 Tax=Portunus trituberculatus TaxID=210409 RepID=UPI001E1CF0BA|nr:poly [ADP-ribose] polymerase tankyrase-like isoform X3 [Portunus trituberculatus]